MNLTLLLLLLLLFSFPKEAPKPNFNNLKSKKASSFHEFARSTNDAWDLDDDEDEDFLSAQQPSLPPSQHSSPPLQQVTALHSAALD